MGVSFYSESELRDLGFKAVGHNVCISRKASIYSPEKISIGSNVRVDDFCILSGGSGIEIGSYVHIAYGSALFGNAGIVIEDFANISSRTAVYTYSDDYTGLCLMGPTIPEKLRTRSDVGPVILKKLSIIGTNSTIMPNVTIGEGVAVGAHSLVTKSLEPWGIYVGTPVKFLKPRKKDLLAHAEILMPKSKSSQA